MHTLEGDTKLLGSWEARAQQESRDLSSGLGSRAQGPHPSRHRNFTESLPWGNIYDLKHEHSLA